MQDGHLLCATDIDHFADGLRDIHQLDHRLSDIFDMGKRPSLCAIAIDREGLMLQCLLHKTRDDHAVAPRLAWPYSIEKPYDDYWQLLGPAVGQSGELVDQFGSRITPARFGRRAVDAVV